MDCSENYNAFEHFNLVICSVTTPCQINRLNYNPKFHSKLPLNIILHCRRISEFSVEFFSLIIYKYSLILSFSTHYRPGFILLLTLFLSTLNYSRIISSSLFSWKTDLRGIVVEDLYNNELVKYTESKLEQPKENSLFTS